MCVKMYRFRFSRSFARWFRVAMRSTATVVATNTCCVVCPLVSWTTELVAIRSSSFCSKDRGPASGHALMNGGSILGLLLLFDVWLGGQLTWSGGLNDSWLYPFPPRSSSSFPLVSFFCRILLPELSDCGGAFEHHQWREASASVLCSSTVPGS